MATFFRQPVNRFWSGSLSSGRHRCRHSSERLLSTATAVYFRSESQGPDSGETHTNGRSDQEPFANEDREPQKPLYEHHIPTTILQKSLLSIGSAAAAILDPYRDDMVAVFGETTGPLALKRMQSVMMTTEEGRDILKIRPRITSANMDLERLRTLPDGTLGREYVRFLDTNKVTPDTRKDVHFVDDPDLAYVMTRYRETHDFTHALLDCPTNIVGEVIVKWIEAIQTGLPMCWSAAIFGPLQMKTAAERSRYLNHLLPWAFECGHKALPLYAVYYERRLDQTVHDLRRELKIPQLPNPFNQ